MKGNNTYGDIVNDKFNELVSADMNQSWRQVKDTLEKEMPGKKKKRYGLALLSWRKSEAWLFAALMILLVYVFSTRLNKLPEESIRAHERLYGPVTTKGQKHEAKEKAVSHESIASGSTHTTAKHEINHPDIQPANREDNKTESDTGSKVVASTFDSSSPTYKKDTALVKPVFITCKEAEKIKTLQQPTKEYSPTPIALGIVPVDHYQRALLNYRLLTEEELRSGIQPNAIPGRETDLFIF